ncbi:MAG: putative peptidoglycan lipid II flippase [Planctomycetota bacterium]
MTKEVVSTGEHVVQRQAGVGKRTVWISVLTLVSRILGLVREVISAGIFGDASAIYDAFLFAWRIPNMFRRFLGEGAMSVALQASMTKADSSEGNAAGRDLFVSTIRLLAGILTLLCVLVMIAVWILPDVMPGTDFMWLGKHPEAVREFTVRLMPFVIFVCLTAAVGGALNVRGHYALPALAPILLNAIWIASLCVIGYFSVEAAQDGLQSQLALVRWLVWGVLFAGVAQLALLLPALRSRELSPPNGWFVRPSAAARKVAVTVLKRSAPLALGAAVYQINVMIDGLMAQSLLPEGGQTVHYLANRVQQFPLALVAIAATTAVFPALAAFGQQGRLKDLRQLHDRTQRAVLFVALPATIGLVVLAVPVTSALFEHGNFGAVGVQRTSSALRMLALAILPAGAVGLLARTYYAVGDYKTPVRISCLMLFINVALNFGFIRLMGMDADGLALATTITSFGNMLFLLPGLSKKLGLPKASGGFFSALSRMLIAASICGFCASYGLEISMLKMPTALALALAIILGVLAYVFASKLLGVEELAPYTLRFQRIWTKFREN